MTKEIYLRGLNQSEGGTGGTTIRRGFRAKTGAAAELTTALTGVNNDLTFTARTPGTGGNNIDVTYSDPGGATATLGVVTDGDHIVVSLGRAASAINTTATALKAAVEADVRVGASAVLTSTNVEVADGDTVTINDKTYRFKDTMALAYDVKRSGNATVAAFATLSSDGTPVADAATVVINDRTYRFKDTMAQAYDIQRSGTSDTNLENLIAAVNQSGTEGVEYYAGTLAPTDVTSADLVGTGATAVITLTATTKGTGGNAYDKAGATHLVVDGAGGGTKFSGGVGTGGEGSADETLANLVAAVNETGTEGVEYYAGTVGPTNVTASAVGVPTAHKVTFTANIPAGEIAGNSYTSTKSSSPLSFADTTFNGGSDGANTLVTVKNAQGNSGAGLVTALTTTALTEGTAAGFLIINNSASNLLDVDDPAIRKILGRYSNEWIETLTSTNLVYIRSLGASKVTNANSAVDRGFRIKNSGGTYSAVIPDGAAVRVDLNDPLVRKTLKQHYSQWIVGNNSNKLVTISGLVTSEATGYKITRGFRIKEYTTGLPVAVTPEIDVQVDLSDAYVRRILRRNIGRYVVVASS
jgi:hypothetical protein